MISAQTPLAFVARENRYPLFRIMLKGEIYYLQAVGIMALLREQANRFRREKLDHRECFGRN